MCFPKVQPFLDDYGCLQLGQFQQEFFVRFESVLRYFTGGFPLPQFVPLVRFEPPDCPLDETFVRAETAQLSLSYHSSQAVQGVLGPQVGQDGLLTVVNSLLQPVVTPDCQSPSPRQAML